MLLQTCIFDAMVHKKFSCFINKLQFVVEYRYDHESDVKGRMTTVNDDGKLMSAISFTGDCRNSKMFADTFYPDPPEIQPYEEISGVPWLIQKDGDTETLTIETILLMPGHQVFNKYILLADTANH